MYKTRLELINYILVSQDKPEFLDYLKSKYKFIKYNDTPIVIEKIYKSFQLLMYNSNVMLYNVYTTTDIKSDKVKNWITNYW